MVNNMAPQYLSSLVPPRHGQSTTYQLRNNNDLVNISTRTSHYASSFLPSTINLWNSLPVETRSLNSFTAFKQNINRNKPKPIKLYCSGDRRLQVLHTRLRTRCSSLAYHLFSKNLVNSPNC